MKRNITKPIISKTALCALLALSLGLLTVPANAKKRSNVQDEINQVESELGSLENNRSRTRFRKKRTKRSKKWGVNIFMHYNSVDHLDTTTNSNTVNDGRYSQTGSQPAARTQGEYQTSAAPGIGIEYSKIRLMTAGPVGFGFDVGGAYEFEREIERGLIETYGTSVSSYITYTEENPTMSLFIPYANLNMSYKRSYMFGGINYSMPDVKNASNEIYDSKMGLQLGFGSAVSSWVSVEVMYRVVNMTVSPRNDYNDLRLLRTDEERDGLGVLTDEELSFKGLTLNMKVRF